jgi:hypothetical protein
MDTTMTDISVLSVMCAEYALLCVANYFKMEFDEYAKDHEVTTIPSAYTYYLLFNAQAN